MTSHRRNQRGSVVLEAALVLPAMLLLLWGVVSFGAIFYTQIALTRAAEDGATAANLLRASFSEGGNIPSDDVERIKDEIINSLSASPIAPKEHNGTIGDRRAWLAEVRNNIQLISSDCNGASCLRIRIVFPYDNGSGTRILPSITIPVIGDMNWLPDTLVGEASVLL
ncbi:TadE/TadG family type IV pilus assembly protein [Algiphilus sp.]|uniref:TadE/TadG family type IV pilus assembly protein n=1 Tax=Algiphilus sp. TaxID=1872431 RepID=UPI0025B925CB|nr:TadE/TadG family type IV pilus assembly protein [Algiphilus sp.]MCK5770255.1 pilus assembly protein [Algiphilus sp.]